MVTDAAGTGFEIKKPHKGTETNIPLVISVFRDNLKLRNPIRGRKQNEFFISHFIDSKFEIKKPHKGTETESFG